MELKFGVRAHDLVDRGSPEQVAEAVKMHGFSFVQLVFSKAFQDPSFSSQYVHRVQEAFLSQGVSVAMLGAYFNPVHSRKDVVEQGVRYFEENLFISRLFGHAPVGSETGSYNDSPWTFVPKNHTEEAYQRSKQVFSALLSKAEKEQADIAVEPAWAHVIYDTKTLLRLVGELSSSRLYVTIDLLNLLNEKNFAERNALFLEALQTFRSRIRFIHLKDAKVIDGKIVQFAPGEGDFDYPFMMASIREYCPEATLIFEGVKADKIDGSFAYLNRLL